MIRVLSLWKITILIIFLSSCASMTNGSHPRFVDHISFNQNARIQVIEVAPDRPASFRAHLTAWSGELGLWRKVFGPWPVTAGRAGFAPAGEKKEGDGRTPTGVFPIRLAFGRDMKVSTGLPYRQASENDIWIDDVGSPEYNRWKTKPTLAASYEEMLRLDGLYDLGAVIEYNTDPVIPGNGSAIFLHIWREGGRRPTAGCVGLERRRLQRLLSWLDLKQDPVIILDPESLYTK